MSLRLMEKKTFPNKILRKMFYTKGARFTCQKRLMIKSRRFTSCVAWLSVLVFVGSIVPISIGDIFSENQIRFLGLFTMAASVAILALSLLESPTQYVTVAEAVHRCATEINRLYDTVYVGLETGENLETLQVISEKYHDIIERCPHNHDSADYQKFKSEVVDEIFDGPWLLRRLFAIWMGFGYALSINYYFALVAVFVSAFIAIFVWV